MDLSSAANLQPAAISFTHLPSDWSLHWPSLVMIVASGAIIGAGVVDDLRSRKFHNWLFIVCSVFAFALVVSLSGIHGLLPALTGFMAGILIPLPLVLAGVMGAGDMKLMAAAGVLIGWSAVCYVLFFAMVWGAVFGVLRTAMDGKLPVMARNLARIVSFQPREKLELNQIPFTVAILLGWMSQLVLQG